MVLIVLHCIACCFAVHFLTFPSPFSGTPVRKILIPQVEKYTKWLITGVPLSASTNISTKDDSAMALTATGRSCELLTFTQGLNDPSDFEKPDVTKTQTCPDLVTYQSATLRHVRLGLGALPCESCVRFRRIRPKEEWDSFLSNSGLKYLVWACVHSAHRKRTAPMMTRPE